MYKKAFILFFVVIISFSCNNNKVKKITIKDDRFRQEFLIQNYEVFKINKYTSEGYLISSCDIKNGKINGQLILYFYNGPKMAVINFKNGERNGKSTMYKKDGSVFEIDEFKDGKLIK